MYFRQLGALILAGASTAQAFQDASPFFIASSTPLRQSFDSSQLISSAHIVPQIRDALSKCPSDAYVVVSQPAVSVADYSEWNSAPHLSSLLAKENQDIVLSLVVPEVLHGVKPSDIVRFLQEKCGTSVVDVDAESGVIPNSGNTPRTINLQFPALPLNQGARASELAQHDSFLHSVVTSIKDTKKYTIIYTTTPAEDGQATGYSRNGEEATLGREHAMSIYEMDEPFPSALHTELKRDVSSHAENSTANLPLFEKYMFLSDGIFMGLLVSILLLSILYVGITAVASLEVSYFAFSKEMGPQAQKKQG